MKASTSRAKARTTPPTSTRAAETPKGPPMDVVAIASGPNMTGSTDQVASVHVDEDGHAPIDVANEEG